MRDGIFKLTNGVLVERKKFEPKEAGTWVFGTVTEIDGREIMADGNAVEVDMRPRDWSATTVELIGE